MDIFWAKTPTDRQIIPDWTNFHSVFHHCVDVGLVAERLLDARWRSLRPILQQVYSDPDEAFLAVTVVAASHDLGKISWWFQARVESLIARLIEAGYERPRGTELQHGYVTTLYLEERLRRDWETPPLARGRRHHSSNQNDAAGNTPARAGKTFTVILDISGGSPVSAGRDRVTRDVMA